MSVGEQMMKGGHRQTNHLHDIHWGALDHASCVPHVTTITIYVYVCDACLCVRVCVCACVTSKVSHNISWTTSGSLTLYLFPATFLAVETMRKSSSFLAVVSEDAEDLDCEGTAFFPKHIEALARLERLGVPPFAKARL